MFDEFDEKATKTKSWEYYRDVVSRRRWWIIVPAFGVWVLAWSASWFVPAAYRSETLILVEQQKVPEQYVVPNVATDMQERLQSMTQQILSRTRLLRIIDQFHLYSELRSRLSPDEIVEKMRGDIQLDLVEAGGRRDDLTAFKISYSARDPRLTQQVTNQLTSLFIDENLKAREQQSQSTTTFLEDQLEEARKNLSSQEQKVREFKSKFLGALPGQMESNVQILSGMQSRLQSELESLNQSKQQNLYLESLLNQYRGIRAGLENGTADDHLPPALDQELARLKTELAAVQSHYTERHPDYRKLKDQIAKVEKMKDKIASDLQVQSAGSKKFDKDDADFHPSDFQQLSQMSPMLQVESQLKANQLEIQNRQKQVTQLESQIQEYQARINETPVREQQLSDLTRDYDQSRTNYDSLLAKRNQSSLATDLEKRQQGEQFRIIDPASLPVKPYKPDRMLFGVAGLIGGLFVGLLCLAAVELVDDRIYGEKDLDGLVNAPVLSEIPALTTALEILARKRRLRLEWMSAVSMIIVIAAGLVFTYYRG